LGQERRSSGLSGKFGLFVALKWGGDQFNDPIQLSGLCRVRVLAGAN